MPPSPSPDQRRSRGRPSRIAAGVFVAIVGHATAGELPGWLPPATVARCQHAIATPAAAALHARGVGLLASRGVARPQAWTAAVLTALCANELPMDAAHLSLVFAFIERESGFDPHGRLPQAPDGFRKLAHRLIGDLVAGDTTDFERLLGKPAAANVVRATIHALRQVGLLDRARLLAVYDRYHQRFGWGRVATEWDVEHVVARDLLTLASEVSPVGVVLRAALAVLPAWRERLASAAVLNSIGALQMSPQEVVRLTRAEDQPLDEAQARQLLYTIDGGVHYGVVRLKPCIVAYTALGPLSPAASSWIAADWRLGPFASRNAALVQQIGRLSGRSFAADTSLGAEPVRAALTALAPLLDGHAAPTGLAPRTSADRFVALAGQARLAQAPWFGALHRAYAQRFSEPPALGLVPDRRFYTAKTGAYRLSQITNDTRQRFIANCARLGC